jgi:hypothetical protein
MLLGVERAAMKTFWTYVRFQAMMFVFGIVGPIFLVIYFATQPNTDMRWAWWAGLFITAADILIALGLTASVSGGSDKPPTDTQIALAVARRLQSGRGDSH